MHWTPITIQAQTEPTPRIIKKQAVKTVFRYFTESGELLFLNLLLENGERVPYSYCENDETGERAWRPVCPDNAPIFNGDGLFLFPDATVIIFPSETICVQFNKQNPEHYIGVSYADLKKSNWKTLAGRTVMIWDSHDTNKIKAAINDECAFVIKPPKINPEDWDARNIIDAIEQQQLDAAAPQELQNIPFRLLGYNDGTFYYIPNESLQIVALTASAHNKAELLQIAPMKFWAASFPGEDSPVNWTTATDYLLREQYAIGVFDNRKIRGRGAWIDRRRVVYHSGENIHTGIKTFPIDQFPSDFIYTKSTVSHYKSTDPLDNESAFLFSKLCESISFKNKLSGRLLAGWCVLAPICGVLRWRPHAWLNGPRGTGKSYIIENIIKPAVGQNSIQVLSSSTEAGIRQRLKADAVPIIFDEAETNDKRGQDRMNCIIEFARACSSDTTAVIAKGTPGGAGINFKPRGMFLFASIGVAATLAADTSRIVDLELTKSTNMADFQTIKSLIKDTVGNNHYCEALRSRALQLAPVIQINAEIFASVVGEYLEDSRLGDQFGTLLAGVYSLYSTKEINRQMAVSWVEEQDWSMFRQTEADTDQVTAMNILMAAKIRLDDGIFKTVDELIDECQCTWAPEKMQTLLRYGIKIDKLSLFIANKHPELDKIFSNTPWEGKYKDQFGRLPGAEKIKPMKFGNRFTSRAVKIPIQQITN